MVRLPLFNMCPWASYPMFLIVIFPNIQSSLPDLHWPMALPIWLKFATKLPAFPCNCNVLIEGDQSHNNRMFVTPYSKREVFFTPMGVIYHVTIFEIGQSKIDIGSPSVAFGVMKAPIYLVKYDYGACNFWQCNMKKKGHRSPYCNSIASRSAGVFATISIPEQYASYGNRS